jgi:transposase
MGVMLPARFFQARGGWKDWEAKKLPEYLRPLTAYNGIVPTVRSSGEREQQGSITRPGCSEVRGVWIQAAHSLVPSRQPSAAPLQKWFWTVARRRGVRTAMVAFARKMLSLAFYLLRDGTQYEPLRLRQAAA